MIRLPHEVLGERIEDVFQSWLAGKIDGSSLFNQVILQTSYFGILKRYSSLLIISAVVSLGGASLS